MSTHLGIPTRIQQAPKGILMTHRQNRSPNTMKLMAPKHLLGSGPNKEWLDMSDYLVHFTSKEETFKQILLSGTLKCNGPFGFHHYRNEQIALDKHRSVCFSEAPLDQLDRLARRKGYYGIGFPKSTLKQKGATRVWYIDENSPQAKAIHNLATLASKQSDRSAPIWELTPFIDPIIPDHFTWDHEREWRIQGDLEFHLDEISLLITPDSLTELPEIEGIFNNYQELELTIVAFPPQLEEVLCEMIDRFHSKFCDPVHVLPTDHGEYVGTDKIWSTEEALEDLFPIISHTIFEELTSFLNSESFSWVKKEGA